MRFYTKILISFALLSAAAISLMLYFSIMAQREIVKKIDADVKNVIRSVHYSTQKLSSEKSSDQDALARFIEEARKNSAVSEVTVINKDERVVASTNPKKMGTTKQLTGKEMVIREEFGADSIPGKHNRFVVEIPIMRDGHPIGLVQTTLFFHDYGVLLHGQAFKSLVVAAVAFAGFLILFTLVLFRLNKPLRQLTIAAKEVGRGDLSISLPNPHNDEIGELTSAFSVMVTKLAKQKEAEDRLARLERDAILSETAAMLSHEIRNPLNLIGLTVDHVTHEYASVLDEKKQSEFLGMMATLKVQVKKLNEMVTEFLIIGKPIKLHKTNFLLFDLVMEIEEMNRQHIVIKQITVANKVSQDIALTADREQMQLVLVNLFLNALSAVSLGGSIEIAAEETFSTINIFVNDNGFGIRDEDKDRVFEPYYSKRPGGTGLGLALVKRIVELHEGTISVIDIPQGGCSFVIVIPKEKMHGTGSDC